MSSWSPVMSKEIDSDEYSGEEPHYRKASPRAKKVLWTMAIVLLIIAYPWFYLGLPIKGRVVDAVTGEPLEGVNVLAVWDLYSANLVHSSHEGELHIAEDLTDSAGKYRLSPWFGFFFLGELRSSAPLVYFYKYGYRVNGGGDSRRHPPFLVVSSDFDGKTVELSLFHGSRQEYAKHLGDTIDSTIGGIRNENCILLEVPQVLQALEHAQTEFHREGIRIWLHTPGRSDGRDSYCGGIAKYWRRLLF